MTNKRRLGKSEMNVSPLSFGASALGGVFGVADESESVRSVHAALEHGINYYDVAPAYGATRAEEVLGKALMDVPRDRYYLSTKAGKYATAESGGKDYFDYSEATIRKSLEESMDRLGVDFLDIVHLHDFEYQGRKHVEWALDEGFATLAALKQEGRIGSIGAGIYPMDLWARVVAEAPVDAILVHNHYNLNDTRLVDLLPACKKKDIGVISASPFASGLLSGGMIADWHPADAHDVNNRVGEAAKIHFPAI
jgi:L-galactose dehydrogenase